MDMTDAECAVVLAVAGIVLVGLIATLIHERLAVIGKNLVEEKDNEKMSNEKMNNEMPELKAGDLIKTSYGRWILEITPKAWYWLVGLFGYQRVF